MGLRFHKPKYKGKMTERVTYDIFLKDNVTSVLSKIGSYGNSVFSGLQKKANSIKLPNLTNISNSFNEIGQATNSILAPIANFGKGIFEATAEYQKFEAVLTNTLGSQERAVKAMKDITDFAAKTPFQVNELTDSYVKLVNRGFQPTMAEMTKLGDLASSLGKPFDQLTEAVLDAQTGEFERLKEFGIKATKAGDQISFTFKGQTKTVTNSEKAIRDYVLALGDVQGVSGSMAGISKTLGGQLSNLQDKFGQLQVKVGKELAPAFSLGLDGLSGFIDAISSNFAGFQKAFDSIATAFSPIGQVFSSVFGEGTKGGLSLGGVLDFVAKAFQSITPYITSFAQILYPVLNFVKTIGIVIYNGFVQIGTSVGALFSTIAPYLNQLFTSIATNINWVYLFSSAFDLVTWSIQALTPFIVALFRFLTPIFDILTRIVGVLVNVTTWLAKAFGGAILGVIGGIGTAVEGVAWAIEQVVNGLMNVFKYLGLISSETDASISKAQSVSQIKGSGKGFMDLFGDVAKEAKATPNNTMANGLPMASMGTTATPNNANSSLQAGIAGVQSDAKAARNITINIQKIGDFYAETSMNLAELRANMKQVAIEGVLGALNDANINLGE